jgi:predicted lipoprotein with Yx(FWY)xxD motif
VKYRVQIATTIAVSAGLVTFGTTSPALAAHHHKGMLVKSHQISLGKVLTNSKGRYLYLYNKDTKRTSHCHGFCLTTWPRVTSKHPPRAGTGVKGKHLGRTTHNQVTYYGRPLYYFVGDPKRTHTGEAQDGFYLISTAGKAVKPKSSGGGGGGGGGGNPPPPYVPPAPTTAAVVNTGSATVHGSSETVLTNDANGKSLYYLSNESATTFHCTSTCQKTWVPLMTDGDPTIAGGSSASGADLGSTVRADDNNEVQVTYNGYPVYTYTADNAAGTAIGDGAPGVGPGSYWYALALL